MIYMEPKQLGMDPPITSWMNKELPKNLTAEQRQVIEVIMSYSISYLLLKLVIEDDCKFFDF